MKPVDAVIFDYGGVISVPVGGALVGLATELGVDSVTLLDLLFGEGAALADSGGGDPVDGPTVTDPTSVVHEWHQLEVGAITLADYVMGISARAPHVIGREVDLALFAELSRAIPVGVHWTMVHEIRALQSRGIARALLTNNVAEFASTWRTTFPVDELFPVVIDSSAVGMRKPDPAIYLLTCESLGVEPDACVFLDDNRYNCDAASALGIEAIQVGDDPEPAIASLRATLTRRGTRTAAHPEN